jgi:hypothetical protein
MGLGGIGKESIKEKYKQFSSFSRLLDSGCKWEGMGLGRDWSKEMTSNPQAFLDFCTLAANEIKCLGEWIKMRKGSRWEKDQEEKRTSNSKGFLDFYTLVAKGDRLGIRMDPAMTRTSISQAFVDFCTQVANGIGWAGDWIKLSRRTSNYQDWSIP